MDTERFCVLPYNGECKEILCVYVEGGNEYCNFKETWRVDMET